MQKRELLAGVVSEWVRKAENDLRNATHTLTLEDDCPTDTVCFHAQQCVEKYLKAFMAWKGIPFSKTHDVSVLVALLPVGMPELLTVVEQELLTDYAVISRYPGDDEEPSPAAARKAVRIARRVRKHIRASLPREALRMPCLQKKPQ
ncbi:MAG TPA: HEPN domain-containing protein [Dissulfurispiraceae bacterium]|nr:HEPN domain-containing protein [Dissulfurispiraceae bacterium]